MPEDKIERVRRAIQNHQRMGDSKREAITTTAETFEGISLDQIESIADQVYGEKRKPEMMEAAEEEGEEGLEEKMEEAGLPSRETTEMVPEETARRRGREKEEREKAEEQAKYRSAHPERARVKEGTKEGEKKAWRDIGSTIKNTVSKPVDVAKDKWEKRQQRKEKERKEQKQQAGAPSAGPAFKEEFEKEGRLERAGKRLKDTGSKAKKRLKDTGRGLGKRLPHRVKKRTPDRLKEPFRTEEEKWQRKERLGTIAQTAKEKKEEEEREEKWKEGKKWMAQTKKETKERKKEETGAPSKPSEAMKEEEEEEEEPKAISMIKEEKEEGPEEEEKKGKKKGEEEEEEEEEKKEKKKKPEKEEGEAEEGIECAQCGRIIGEGMDKAPPPPREIAKGQVVCDDCWHDLHPEEGAASVLGVKIFPMTIAVIISSLAIFISASVAPSYGGLLVALGIVFFSMEHSLTSQGIYSYVRASFRTFGFLCLATGLAGIHIFGMTLVPGVFGNRPVFKLIPLGIMAVGVLTYNSTAEIGISHKYRQALAMQKTLMGIFLTLFFIQSFWSGLIGGGGWMGWFMVFAFTCLGLAFFIVFPKGLSFQGTIIGDMGKDLKDVQSAGEKGVQTAAMAAGTAEGGPQAGQMAGQGAKAAMEGAKGATSFAIKLFFLLFAGFAILLSMGAIMGTYQALGMPVFAILGAAGGAGGAWVISALNATPDKMYFGGLTGLGIVLGMASLAGSPFAIFFFFSVMFLAFIAGFPAREARPVIGVPMIFLALIAATTAYPSVMGEAVFGQWWPTVSSHIQTLRQSFAPALGQVGQVQTTLGRGWTCLASPQQCYQIYKPKTKAAKTYRAMVINRITPTGIGKIKSPPTQMEGSFKGRVVIENALTSKNAENPPTIPNVTITPTVPIDAAHRERTVRGPKDLEIGEKGWVSGGECTGWTQECKVDKYYPGMKGVFTVKYNKSSFYNDLDPGGYFKYGVDAEYGVTTHSVLDVEVLKKERYKEQARKGELEFYEPTSTYEWGPISIGIAVSRQQPIKGGDKVPIIVSITNRGRGYLTKIKNFNISATPRIVVNNQTLFRGNESCAHQFSESFRDELHNKMREQSKEANMGVAMGLKPKDSIVRQCLIEVENPEVIRKTFGITADLNYDYLVTRTDTAEVIYECADDEDCKEDEHCGKEYRCIVGEEEGDTCLWDGDEAECFLDDVWKDRHCCPGDADGCEGDFGWIKSEQLSTRITTGGGGEPKKYSVDLTFEPKYASVLAKGSEHVWTTDPCGYEAKAAVGDIKAVMRLPSGVKTEGGDKWINATQYNYLYVYPENGVGEDKETFDDTWPEHKCINVTESGDIRIWMQFHSEGYADYDWDRDQEFIENEVKGNLTVDITGGC